jgi:two-component system sensor histidine kinase EvgS
LAATSLFAQPDAKTSPLKFSSGCEIDYPPFCLTTPDGKATGFSVELLNAVLAEMNCSATYETGVWGEIKAKLERGELDVLPLVGRTPEREKTLDFSVPYMTLQGCLIVRDDEEEVLTVHDLKGKEVAVMKNDNAEEFIDRNDHGFIKQTYPTFADALQQLSKGHHRAVIAQKLVAVKLIKELGITNLKILRYNVPGFHQDFCFAVPEGKKDSLAILNEGLAKVIANGTYDVLHAKWFADLEIAEDPTIIVGADLHYPPFEFVDENGHLTGFNYDLMNAVASATGLRIQFKPDQWTKTVEKLEHGQIDMIQGMFFSPDRAAKFSFSAPTVVSHCVSVVRKNSIEPPDRLEDLARLRLVVEENDIMHDFVRRNNLASNTIAVVSQESALLEVVTGRRDCALVSRMTAAWLIRKNSWANLEMAKKPLLSPKYCFATRQSRRGLLAKLNEGLKIIENSGEYHRIVERWFGVEQDSARELKKLLRYVLIITGPLILALFVFFFWSWSLKQQVLKKTEDLRKSEEQFRSLIEGAPFGVFVQTRGQFSYLNQTMLNLLGLSSPAEMLGKPVIDAFNPEFQVEVSQRILQLNFEKLAQEPMRNSIVRSDGQALQVEVSAVPTHFAGEDGALVFVRDISHQLELEARLLQSSKMEAVGQLAGGVAHDYNNMLSVILGYTELALSRIPSDDPVHQNLTEIYAAATRSADITAQLLAFARKQIVTPKVLLINRNIEGMLKMLSRLIGEDIKLIWEPGQDIFPIKIDPIQLDQILANLCVNARDAISGSGEVKISTQNRTLDLDDDENTIPSGNYVVLTVSDNGCGMTHLVKEKIFEPFFTTKELGRGTGLGLATVYGIIKQNNGHIIVTSSPRVGTSFEILFPMAQTEESEHHATDSKEVPKGKKQTILLVEDEEAILKLTRKVIEGFNYQVIAANFPSAALEIVKDGNQQIDLLITDIVMPEMNGKELYLKIKSLRPGIKVLFVSGYTAEIVGSEELHGNDVDFIEKPFAIKELARKINEVIMRKD